MMKVLNMLTKCLYILFLALAVNSESYYSINAPGVIKSNRKYPVVATLHQGSGPCSIRISIKGPNFDEFKDVNLEPFESKIIEFFPKKLQEGKFFLKAEGLTGLNFKNETIIHEILDEGPKIYIQTDKSVYKPKDLVNFRVVVLDEHTRPLHIADPIHVEILDSEKNRVKHFKNISLKHGTFTDKFQLSQYPRTGYWAINVVIDGTYDYSMSKAIKISNYDRPKFNVYLRTPTNVLLEDGKIRVLIYGKYTFDKYVEGYATIQLWSYDKYGKENLLQFQSIDLQNIDFVDFNLTTIKDIDKYDKITIKATLIEKYTIRAVTEEQEVILKRQRYNLLIKNDDIEFENNKPYSIKVYAEHWTGAPVLDHKTPVKMQHGDKMYESYLDTTGAATFEFDYDANTNYKFKFKDSKKELANIYAHGNLMLNNREYYCRLKLLDKRLKLGEPVLIEVSSIINIPYLMYTVMGHASLIRTEYIKVPHNQKSYTINITPSIEMIPRSFIYVYYVHKGNLRYEEMTLEFPAEFENQISLSAPKQVKPGSEVTLTINAEPMSYVSIMAVDLSVYLLDHKYDLYKYKILGDLQEEKSYSSIGSPDYPGIISGLITLTNAHYRFRELYPPPTEHERSLTATGFSFRQKFPETWIFGNYLIKDKETKLTLQIPDTITTWRITAFSNNALTGFGIVNNPTDITTIKTFFISLNLPYAVKRGEFINIPVTIMNYSNQTLNTEVILLNENKYFNFVESDRPGMKTPNDVPPHIKHISIEAYKGKTITFLIIPIKAGEINIKVTATSSLYSDAVLQKLKVEPEGVAKQQNQALYLSIPEGEKISSNLKITYPIDSVPDSQYITFSVGGHYLVPTVEHFESLTQMHAVTGEENMINFAPGVLILQYLKLNGKLLQEKAFVESLKSSIEDAYQQQMSFRHNNGGYSVFGMYDEEPSTWLTAYVVRYLIKASQFMDIETSIIEKDLKYLASQQKSNGEFLFTDDLLNPNHKNEYGLTAFILLAFLENQKYADMHWKIIENGVEFLNSNLNNVNDINSLSLMAAVIKRSKCPNAGILINRLKSLCKEINGLRWWSENDQNPANDVEITANAALALLDTPGDHTSILKWLIEQRNANGGFKSGYDTVAGMEALVKFAEKYTDFKNINLKISYSAKDELGNKVATDEFYVDSNNALNFQKHELPTTTRHVIFEIEGSGASLVQLTQQYNINNEQEFRHFNIQTRTIVINEKQYILGVCFSYVPEVDTSNGTTNMIIMEVNLPSGVRSASESEYLMQNHVKKVQTKNDETVVIFCLDKLKAYNPYCLEIPVAKVDEIWLARPAAIVMYDYYNLSRSNTEFYML